jgi:hypothetical protein
VEIVETKTPKAGQRSQGEPTRPGEAVPQDSAARDADAASLDRWLEMPAGKHAHLVVRRARAARDDATSLNEHYRRRRAYAQCARDPIVVKPRRAPHPPRESRASVGIACVEDGNAELGPAKIRR